MALKIVLLALLICFATSEAQSQGDDTSLPLSYDVTEPNCLNDVNPHIPSFVGDDFFCNTGTYAGPAFDTIEITSLLHDHPLWDGGGCGPTGTCCESNNPPWFCKTLPQPTTDDIEVRICADQALADEEVTIGLIEIYVN